MSEPNREACAAATKPLINSVESLTAYALSPEFAPLPAKISDEVRSFCVQGYCGVGISRMYICNMQYAICIPYTGESRVSVYHIM